MDSEKLRQIIEKTPHKTTMWFIPVSKVKEKVLSNALSGFAKECRPENAVALMDTTLTGNGKNGYLISTEGIYGKSFSDIVAQQPKTGFLAFSDYVAAGHNTDFEKEPGEWKRYSRDLFLLKKDGTVRIVFAIFLNDMINLMNAILAEENGTDGEAAKEETISIKEAEPDNEPEICEEPEPDEEPEICEESEPDEEPEIREEPEPDMEPANENSCSSDEPDIDIVFKELMKAVKDGTDTTQPYNMLLKAAETGNAKAAMHLGDVFCYGSGVEKNESEAFRWYEISAKGGDLEAIRVLSFFYATGEGVEKDEEKGMQLLRFSAEHGDSESMYDLGIFLEMEDKDDPESFQWFQKSAELGNTYAMLHIGNMYLLGDYETRVDPDPSKAEEWFRKAAAAGEDMAYWELGSLYNPNQTTPEGYPEPDMEKAMEFFIKGAELGNSDSKRYLAALYQQGGFEGELREKLRLWFIEEIENLRIGDTFATVGMPEDTDSCASNRNEWEVIAREGKKSLLISKKVWQDHYYNEHEKSASIGRAKFKLDCAKMQYRNGSKERNDAIKEYDNFMNSIVEDSTDWNSCSLREWLNNTIFYGIYFSEIERRMIACTELEQPDNPKFGTSGGPVTKDRLFLLSIDEVVRYFENEGEKPDVETFGSAESCSWLINSDLCSHMPVEEQGWWLRSPGMNEYFAACANIDVKKKEISIFLSGMDACLYLQGVRPAMWIDPELL